MKTYNVKYNYVSPILMKSLAGIDPLHPLVKEASAINKKHHTKKTDEDRERLLEIDYLLGAYYDDEIGMYIPAEVLEANIRDGAKSSRNGKKAQIAIFVQEERVKLIHDGPEKIEDLYATPEFRDIRAVTINGSKVLRCRPRFNRWSLDFNIELNEELMAPEDFFEAVKIAGSQKGIGDYRPRYGRFVAEITEV